MDDKGYFPPSEVDGGWRVGDPGSLGVDEARLNEAITFHDESRYTRSHGGALVIVYKGHVIGESYVTGAEGGPQPWTLGSCNDVKSSTKSVFGTAVGMFLDEYKGQVSLDSLLVGERRENSLIPQIWDQPITDERKKRIRVKHAISMTSGHDSDEPWLAPSPRLHSPGYSGAYQMYEYCFGWWRFHEVPDHHTLLFEPGHGFNYSNFGLEQVALAMRNLTGEMVGPYAYDRILGPIGMPIGLRENGYREMPYNDPRELNFSGEPGWGVGGSERCNAYGADRGASPYGHNTIVGSTFRCTVRDFARLGYLWLNKGRWGSRQLVPEEWMSQATSRFVQETGESHNYGYTFWIQDEWENVSRDTFGSRGHNMNDCYVVPSLDLVIARQGNDNPPREQRAAFVENLVEKIVQAVPAEH
jgi:CubicO group peptidase (beta-lactamase class C family)